MAEKGKPQEEESGGEGAPLWIISFADMISLLMAFFVMLSTFSSFGPRESEKLKTVARVTVTPNYGWHGRLPQSALRPTTIAAGETRAGSERPALETASNGKTMKATHEIEDKRAKIFVAESSGVFWAKGQSISAQGRRLLDTLAAYFKKMPGQIVICERGETDEAELSITRSVAIIRQLQARGIPRSRCNISAATMLENKESQRGRQLEIVLVDEL